MKKLLIIFLLFTSVLQAQDTVSYFTGSAVPHKTGGFLNDSLVALKVQNEALNGMAGFALISGTDTSFLYKKDDTLKYEFANGQLLKIYNIGDSLVFESTDSIYIAKLTGLPSSVTFGTDNQIPIVNVAGNDFEYSANFTFTGTAFGVNNSSVVFNESGTAVNFRIESDNADSMFYIDGTNNYLTMAEDAGLVGIGTHTPVEKLTIYDDADNVLLKLWSGDSDVWMTLTDNTTGGANYNLFGATGNQLNFRAGNIDLMKMTSSALIIGDDVDNVSGSVNFIASDNDSWNLGINTSDQATFANAGGGYIFDGKMSINTTSTTNIVNIATTGAINEGISIANGGGTGSISLISVIGSNSFAPAIVGRPSSSAYSSFRLRGLTPTGGTSVEIQGTNVNADGAIAATETLFKVRNYTTTLLEVLGNGNTTFYGNILSGAATYNIGSSTTRFNRIYADTVNVNVFTNSNDKPIFSYTSVSGGTTSPTTTLSGLTATTFAITVDVASDIVIDNLIQGMHYTFIFTQDATGYAVTLNASDFTKKMTGENAISVEPSSISIVSAIALTTSTLAYTITWEY